MALRDQPYLPLYIQDFMTDEKLIECSAESTGVYIRVMCLMHKSDQYGKILLKQKYKQNTKQTENFAKQLARSMPYDLLVITRSLDELIEEGVLQMDGDTLIQKRMVKDNHISEIRKDAGSKGAEKKKELAEAKPKAKGEANTENENENEIEYIDVIKDKSEKFKKLLIPFKDKYDRDTLIEFYNYWVEPNKSNTLIRYDLERTWDTGRRLTTWVKNQKGFKANGHQEPSKTLKKI